MADVRIADARLVVGNGVPGPVPFTIFDVVRTNASDSYDPRSGVQDAVGRAIANAPFAPVAWHFPALEVAPFPGPQVLLCRYFEPRTVIVDLRDCSLESMSWRLTMPLTLWDCLATSSRHSLVLVCGAEPCRLLLMVVHGILVLPDGFAVGM